VPPQAGHLCSMGFATRLCIRKPFHIARCQRCAAGGIGPASGSQRADGPALMILRIAISQSIKVLNRIRKRRPVSAWTGCVKTILAASFAFDISASRCSANRAVARLSASSCALIWRCTANQAITAASNVIAPASTLPENPIQSEDLMLSPVAIDIGRMTTIKVPNTRAS
jgi:hypothetical protein